MDSVERSNRTWLCTVVFLDIVAYTQRSVSQQSAMKDTLNGFITEAIQHVSPNDRIIIDTGDGAALCFLGDPEEALFAALHLRDCFCNQDHDNSLSLSVRMGVNVGPTRVVHDINGRLNIIGDGINAAQRVMSFADANQILVSRSFYEVISCLAQEYAQLFHYQGVRTDKHVREHTVYEMMLAPDASSCGQPFGQMAIPRSVPGMVPKQAPVQEERHPPAWPAGLLETVQKQLAQHIGPLAGMLVKQAAQQATHAQQLYQILASHIAEEGEKKQFLQALGPAPASSQPSGGTSLSLQAQAGQHTPRTWPSEMLKQAEDLLANYIGPLAKVLVHREAKNAATVTELYDALARHLSLPEEKDQFLLQTPRT
ncbi:MAG: adenylate/guanylate cyclase domain-containing protein [bacterium]|nr:adenylate/guanylate cyclase domain-containing protein [bacterium]